MPFAPGIVCEVADPVGVELRRQLAPAAPEEEPAPEGVVLVTEAKSVQLDGLQRQDEWILRIRTAENRCLDLPSITPHAPSCSSQLNKA
ncbi:hypothetical protein GCM10010298_70180 [Streptomyces microflavus]|uniref:Uncharacterized protein n=1 Tax=Streptomyces microflavus TaxID=1919 RepID=A0A7J0D4X5_STRMI|nr:hypothetical protein Smic_83240 [Streptomyces microflavus]GGX94743.1 hypothetical protein GCM10010298_70180 [Streptomyces microflavus]